MFLNENKPHLTSEDIYKKINNKKFDPNEYPEKTKGICSNDNFVDCNDDGDCDDIGECNKLDKILIPVEKVSIH